MRSKHLVRSAGLIALLLAIPLAETGCITVKLKKLEIAQLNGELGYINSETTFLSSHPALGANYGGQIFLSGAKIDEFLNGLKNYDIPLSWPAGAKIRIESTQLQFANGLPELLISAYGVDRTNTFKIALRIRADLILTADPSAGVMTVQFAIREIVPDFEFSFLHPCRSLFAAELLTIEANKYVHSLPTISVKLSGDIPINLSPPASGTLTLGGATININENFPELQPLDYKYTPIKIITLSDGLHIFFSIQRK